MILTKAIKVSNASRYLNNISNGVIELHRDTMDYKCRTKAHYDVYVYHRQQKYELVYTFKTAYNAVVNMQEYSNIL